MQSAPLLRLCHTQHGSMPACCSFTALLLIHRWANSKLSFMSALPLQRCREQYRLTLRHFFNQIWQTDCSACLGNQAAGSPHSCLGVQTGRSLVTLANHCLDLALVGWIDVVSVLRPHQHGSVLEGSALHVCPLALYDCGGEDGDHMAGEGCDVARHPHKHPCCALHHQQKQRALSQVSSSTIITYC